jgi:hypothetical protein
MGGVGRSLSERRQSIELAMRFVSTLAEKETKELLASTAHRFSFVHTRGFPCLDFDLHPRFGKGMKGSTSWNPAIFRVLYYM